MRSPDEYSDANTASTSNKEGKDEDNENCFQSQLSHNLARSKEITASVAQFIAQDWPTLRVIKRYSFDDMPLYIQQNYGN